MKKSYYCTLVFLAFCLVGIIPFGFGQEQASTTTAGGRGGSPFSDKDIAPGGRVAEIYVFAGDFIDAVQMSYIFPDGRTMAGPRHGGTGGRRNIFRLDSDEYIIGLSGKYGDYIDSFQIRTNKRTSSVFGGSGGNRSYQINVPYGNQAVGFVGRAGEYLDAVGLTFAPLTIPIAGKTDVFGGKNGSAFSDTDIPLGARISEIRVRAGDYIDSIQIIYILQDGRTLQGPTHGGRGGSLSVFRLDANEYVTGLSGKYGDYIDSLTIKTNKRTSQKFGGRGGKSDFSLSVPSDNQTIGMVGRAGDYLDAIGLNYARLETPQRRNRFRNQR